MPRDIQARSLVVGYSAPGGGIRRERGILFMSGTGPMNFMHPLERRRVSRIITTETQMAQRSRNQNK